VHLSLVVLAAGLGSRFGSLKQLVPVGPHGETILDYTAYDAHRAGFKRIVFVIRQEMVEAFHPFASRFRGALEVKLAFQQTEDAPKGALVKGRVRPWGTAHALLAAAPHVSEALAVCNADDFYGAEAFAAAFAFLRDLKPAKVTWALAGYPADATLSSQGPVNRAVCRVDEKGWLIDLEERRLEPGDVPAGGGTIVSMNLWCFTQELFAHLRTGFDEFAMRAGPAQEYLLPDAVREALRAGLARVKVLPPAKGWFGLTYAHDRETAAEMLRALHAQGRYPESLWR